MIDVKALKTEHVAPIGRVVVRLLRVLVNGGVHLHVAVAVKVHDYDYDYDHDYDDDHDGVGRSVALYRNGPEAG